MGSLVAWGAVGGAGKGLTAAGQEAQRQVGQEKHDSRQVQLQRQRDNAALKRQQTADTAASNRMKEEWAPGGYREQQERVKAGIATTAREDEQIHQSALELMKQQEQTARTRITAGESEFEWTETEADEVRDPFTGAITKTEAGTFVKDFGARYKQEGSNRGTIYLPQGAGHIAPKQEEIEAGFTKKQMDFLLSAPNKEVQLSRKYLYLGLFKFLPAQYFDKYDPVRGRRRTEETTTTIQPANQ